MSYITLSDTEVTHIRWQRVRDLEVEKERLNLLLEEEPDDVVALQKMAIVSRYLELHTSKLPAPADRPEEPVT